MDERVADYVTELRRGFIQPQLVDFAERIGIRLETLLVVLAHLLAERPLTETSRESGVDQYRLNRLIKFRWRDRVQVGVLKKQRRPKPCTGDFIPISDNHISSIRDLITLGVRPRDIHEHFSINLGSWETYFPNSSTADDTKIT